jgi:hypothetical protein
LPPPEIFDLFDEMIARFAFVSDGLVERMVRVFDFAPIDVSGDRNRTLVLAHCRQFGFDRVSDPLAAQRLLQQDGPEVLILDPDADRSKSGPTTTRELLEFLEDRRKPRFQCRSFDLDDVPIEDHQRTRPRMTLREEGDGRGVVVCASFRSRIDHREDAFA